MGPPSRMRLGARGESAAAAFLEKSGYRILARHHTCRAGELDLVAEEEDCLCFVEVRTRRPGPVTGLESVGIRKQRRLARAALDYLAKHGIAEVGERAMRFDVVEVQAGAAGALEVELWRNAFEFPEL